MADANKSKTKGKPHRFKKGESGNPSGRPLFDPDVKKAFIKLAPLALLRCQEILEKKHPTKNADLIKAATLVFAYAYGKPVETVKTEGSMTFSFKRANPPPDA